MGVVLSWQEDSLCVGCGRREHERLAEFQSPPEGENPLPYLPYMRRLWRCMGCGHVVNDHDFDLADFYSGNYREAAYGDVTKLKSSFDRIMRLPPGRSDNRGRVLRINDYFSETHPEDRRLLDVGSGIGVFPVAMTEAGWSCLALDPDPVAVQFLETQGVRGLVGGFLETELPGTYSLITFNKVLEHVPDMVPMLHKAASLLDESGVVYVEVPDGEAALRHSEGVAREEFFIEHFCAPTPASLALLIRRADMHLNLMETLTEPSGKHTIRAFVRPFRA